MCLELVAGAKSYPYLKKSNFPCGLNPIPYPPSILLLSQSRDSAEDSFHIVLVHNLVYAHLFFVEAVES